MRRRLPVDSGQRQGAAIAPNVLDRQFQASGPNRTWVVDFTCLWTAEGWLYVAVVLDLYSRRAVGWSMQNEMIRQLVTDTLMIAAWRRGKPHALLHHSDRGSQYIGAAFLRLLGDLGVTCSMSRSGNVWDGTPISSVFIRARSGGIGKGAARGDGRCALAIVDQQTPAGWQTIYAPGGWLESLPVQMPATPLLPSGPVRVDLITPLRLKVTRLCSH